MTTTTFKVELKPVAWLKPYEKNAKLHPEEQIKRLAATIKKHGWDQPIVTEADGTIIKGHGRRLAAIHLGLTEVPVVVRHDLTKQEADAARISDNVATSVQYDTKLMKDELERLMAEMPEIDLDSLALTDKERKFLTVALDEPALDAIMFDTTGELAAQKEAERERVAGIDDSMVPIAKALGFGKLKKADERVLTAFMAEAEAATGQTGYEAFMGGLRLAVKALGA